MEKYNLDTVYSFLTNLDNNNTKEWFTENKSKYEEAKALFEAFVTDMGAELTKLDPSVGFTKAKDYTFRIYRDVRFSKDKTPYKNHFGAYVSRGGKKSPFAGYYIHIQPDASFIGGGAYHPDAAILKAIRQEIFYGHEAFLKVIHNKEFQQFYPLLMDDKLLRVPKGYPADCQAADWLKYKSYAVSHPLKKEEIIAPDFLQKVMESFQLLKPLNHYINAAIQLAEDE